MNVNINDQLFEAVKSGKLDEVRDLVSKGADVKAKDKDGCTPTSLAMSLGKLDIFLYLASKDIDVTIALDKNGVTHLMACAALGDLNLVKGLIDNGADINAVDNDGWTVMHGTVCHDHWETIKFLIDNGANVNAKIKDGTTPLMLATINNHLEIVKLLVANGADVNAQDNKGRTPMMWATTLWHKDIARFLIKHGAKA